MLLFKPVALDAHLLRELNGASDVDFWLVKDPLVNLNRGCLVQHAELALLLVNPVELHPVPRNGNTLRNAES
jgi:hypothetical protein